MCRFDSCKKIRGVIPYNRHDYSVRKDNYMNVKKRLFSILLCGAILMTSACNTTDDPAATDPAETTPAVVSNAPASVVDGEIRDISSVELISELTAGWNLGNTLDATGGSGLSSETSWGNPKTTK